jgi:hypothetical protein
MILLKYNFNEFYLSVLKVLIKKNKIKNLLKYKTKFIGRNGSKFKKIMSNSVNLQKNVSKILLILSKKLHNRDFR